ncbi:putative ABC transport system permease protein [Dyadobacter jejuensis]|uniref:Putative ABC transport system permease protein n=1 Tax=Dyadobacter jejuensis TaxID=1082580 RepID=A0A316A815_9BACT|nr:ABC transporter permease [Dyadobacter jejuensis]PWJ53579.1 putative ABC transport system permease protein [Dyadobacter jejuensis]
MLTNYIKIAWRNLRRNRITTLINVVGLALGLCASFLIGLYIWDELSYDRYNVKASQIVRVTLFGSMQGGKINEPHVMPPTAATLVEDYPEVVQATRIRKAGTPVVRIGEKLFADDEMAAVDSNFFQVFTLPLLQGHASTVLNTPFSVVISKRLAAKYFGKENSIGKIIQIKGKANPFKITGVFEGIPSNSHFHFDLLTSMSAMQDAQSMSWMTSEYYTYLVLQQGYDYKKLEAKLPHTVDKYMGPQLQKSLGLTMAEFKGGGNSLVLKLQPLTDIHLRSNFTADIGTNGDIKYVYIFSAVGLFMLLIACINFMNLSTASASKRAKEVGIRKVLGATKEELVGQFLSESALLTFIAMVLASILAVMVLPLFNELSGKEMILDTNFLMAKMPLALLFGLFIGILAGGYPAFFLSSFNPVSILRGRFSTSTKSTGLRSGLVVVQFFISIALLAGTLVVYRQLEFIQNKKLGYEKERVIVLSDTWALGKNQEAFVQALLQDQSVANVSASGYVPAGASFNNNYMVYPDSHSTQLVKTIRYDVDYGYLSTLKMEMASGRYFSKDFGNDSVHVVINETAAHMIGWTSESALGHTISHTNNEGHKRVYTVIGVVKDFHFRSLHESISPLVMQLGGDPGYLIVKAQGDHIAALLSRIENNWNKFKPERPFSFSFLDDRYNATYQSERRTGQILGLFASLTVFVACLGLFGLATFTAEQRVKEIGVRRVLGASVTSVVLLLSRDFVKLVGVGAMLAIPVTWYVMSNWLSDFEYRIDLTPSIFIYSSLLSVLVALITISYQSIRAAIANPVKSLKSE